VEFISVEDDRFKENILVLELEKPFLCEFEGIKIRGVIDRIDKKDDSYLVIDYKTSSSLKINTKSNFEKATDFQLEFYYLAVKELFKASNIKSYYYDLYNMKLLEETMLYEKLDVLKEIFKEFKTTSVSFDKCDNNQTCQYCTYKTICNR
jgi:RecB family exonuclease